MDAQIGMGSMPVWGATPALNLAQFVGKFGWQPV